MTVIHAPAKVNLFLKVLGKRPDGYHSIFTFFQKITLFDYLVIDPSPRGTVVSCSNETVPSGESNLVYQAATLFGEYTGLRTNLNIAIRKNIPVSGGLGGGSSDAGCFLAWLNDWYGTPCSPSELLNMARKLGADVPFFASTYNAALGQGIGDLLEPVRPIRPWWFVLINPGFAISTKRIYESLKLTTIENPFIFSRDDVDSIEEFLHNDLEEVTASKHPAILQCKEQLLSSGAIGALMSGSGPTVFGVYRNLECAKLAYQKLSAGNASPEWSVYLAEPLSPEPIGTDN